MRIHLTKLKQQNKQQSLAVSIKYKYTNSRVTAESSNSSY